MPQLNPHPWLFIMLLTWTALIILFMNKTLTMSYPNTPSEAQSKTKHTTSWTWPWY